VNSLASAAFALSDPSSKISMTFSMISTSLDLSALSLAYATL